MPEVLNGPFVVDASLTLSWAFDDEATPFALHVLTLLESVHAVTPALWPFEVANALAAAERQQRISLAQQMEFLERLRVLPIMVEHRPAAWLGQQILPLARAYRLSAYDAAYLEVAIRENLPLATLDSDLKAAALAARVPLINGPDPA